MSSHALSIELFRRASVRFDLVVDRDADAIASYERNLGHRPVAIDVHDFARTVGIARAVDGAA